MTYTTDATGHLVGSGIETVTLPKGSLTDNNVTDSNLITGLSFTDTTGGLTTTRKNIVDLKLDGYATDDKTEGILNSDTLRTALEKLEL